MCDSTILVICFYNGKFEMTKTHVKYVGNKAVIMPLDLQIVTPRFSILRTESGARDYILGIDLFFIIDELVPVGIQTISVITKIIYIYKRITTGVVSIKIYTHILSPIYLYKPLYVYMSNTGIRDYETSAVSTYL